MKMIPVFSCILALAFALLILAPLEAADPLYHELKKGDTLFSIARKFAIPYEALAVANGISDPTKLRIGDRLVIPEMVKVESGDSLSGIARMYGISSEDIRKANRLAVNAIIQPGDILVVPATRPSPPKTTAPPSASASSTTSLPRTSTSTMPATTTSTTVKAKPAASSSTTIPPSPTSSSPPTSTTTIAPRPSTTVPEPPSSFGTSVTLPVEVPALKTSGRVVDRKIAWPCAGEYLYLDGKLDGVMARTLPGETAKAVSGGLVVSAGPARGFGLVAFVQSPSGFVYVYGGNERLSVFVGDTVKSGQEIGTIGVDARDGGPVAYFIVFRDGNSIDPARAPRD